MEDQQAADARGASPTVDLVGGGADASTADATLAGGAGPERTGSGVVRLAAIRTAPLSVDEVLAAVQHPGAGGTALFVGTVRNHDAERAVTALSYTAHPSAIDELTAVAEAVARNHEALAVAATHRVGDLRVGDVAVVVAVACVHRQAAFAACRELIDTLKATVPIWKHQLFGDGTDEWVGSL